MAVITTETPKKPKSSAEVVYDVYRAGTDNKEWAWRAWAKNGKIIADGGEPYKRIDFCLGGMMKLRGKNTDHPIFVNGIDETVYWEARTA